MIRVSQLVVAICLLAHTAHAQFVLNISGNASGTEVTGIFSGAELQIGDNGTSRWGNSTKTSLVTYTFTNGSANTAGGTGLNGLSGSISLWGNNNGKIGRVVLTINDSAFTGDVLTNLTFTASSTDIQFDALQSYIGDKIKRKQKYPVADITNLTISAIPEPSTYAALIGGISLLFYGLRRRKTRRRKLEIHSKLVS